MIGNFPKSPNVIVQGITGKNGHFHTKRMLDYGTKIVAGTSPNKAGQMIEGVPVYQKIADIQQDFKVDASVIFVPAPFAKAAILEAIEAKIGLIIAITEHIPVHDMMYIKQRLANSNSTLLGPNCPGMLVPDDFSLGIIPYDLASAGRTAIISRSGTLTYEAMALLTKRALGQAYVVGIGGDMVQGSSFIDWLEYFENDPDVDNIIMIGEIGGDAENLAAEFIKKSVNKPVYVYVAGHQAPVGVQMGHAGAILSSDGSETALHKTLVLEESGAITANSLFELINKIKV